MTNFHTKDAVPNFELDTKERVLTLPKSELRNINLIVSKIVAKTNLSVFEISEYNLKVLKDTNRIASF